MSSPENLVAKNGIRPAFMPSAESAPRSLHDGRDSWLRTGPEDGLAPPLAGQPGHGRTAFLRRRPVRIVDGRMEGGYASSFELICPSCGDHPYLDYFEVPARLQWLRGPWTLETGLAEYEQHLGLVSRPDDTAGSSRARRAEESAAQAPPTETAGGYRHEALLYSGLAEFLTATASFIRRAVRAGDPILVMVSGPKINALRRKLGAEAENVTFANLAEVGSNPARIIAAWQAFVHAHAGAPRLCGICEPVDPRRSAAELAECQRHEALLNVAFDASAPLWLLCPYDLETLAVDVIDEARRTHPFVACGEDRQPSSAFPPFRPIDLAEPFARPLPPVPPDAARMSFEPSELRRVLMFVAGRAGRSGLDEQSAAAMVLAVNELAANSLEHGGGKGELRLWSDGHSVVCEVSDRGHITAPLAGRVPPGPDGPPGTGLWLANQLCDLVQIHSSPEGTAIRLYQKL